MRILLIEDHQLVREALMFYLEKNPLVSEVIGFGEIEQVQAGETFELVLLDYQLRERRGLDVYRDLRVRLPTTPVIVVSGAITRSQAREMIAAGVIGVISKDVDSVQLWRAIDACLTGKTYLGEDVAIAPASAPAIASLTSRELEVAALIAASKSNKEIAASLGVADITVRLHCTHIYRKLGVRNRLEAIPLLIKVDQTLI